MFGLALTLSEEGKVDKKVLYIVLSVGGGLLFTFATEQIGGMIPDIYLLPYAIDEQNRIKLFYRVLQLGGALAAIYGGVKTYLAFNTKPD